MGTGTGIGNFSFFLVVSEPVSEKIWHRKKVSEPVSVKFGIAKKSWNRYRKDLVPKKVPASVSKIFGTRKKYRYRLTFWVPSHTARYSATLHSSTVEAIINCDFSFSKVGSSEACKYDSLGQGVSHLMNDLAQCENQREDREPCVTADEGGAQFIPSPP